MTSEFAKHIAYKVVSKNGKKFCNGVDVTDLLHSFSKNEWAKLSKEIKTELFENPERKNYSKKRKMNSGLQL